MSKRKFTRLQKDATKVVIHILNVLDHQELSVEQRHVAEQIYDLAGQLEEWIEIE